MVIEVTDYKDVFLAVTKRNSSVLTVDKLNTPGIWHLTFQPEETKYVQFSLGKLILKRRVCVNVCAHMSVKQEVNAFRA